MAYSRSASGSSPTHYRLSARMAAYLRTAGQPLSKADLASKVLAAKPMSPRGELDWTHSLLDDLIDSRFVLEQDLVGLWEWRYPFPAPGEAVAVLDIETTGLSPADSEIAELAIVRVENGVQTVLDSLVNPGMPIPNFITKLTGITNEDVADAEDVYSVLERAIPLLDGATLIIQNASFDLGFLKPRLARLGYRLDNSVVDTIKWAGRALPALPKKGLDALAWAFDIDQMHNRHRALGDVKTTLAVAKEMYYLLSAGNPAPVTKI
jgi:DNA polymerase III subunit epsilon